MVWCIGRGSSYTTRNSTLRETSDRSELLRVPMSSMQQLGGDTLRLEGGKAAIREQGTYTSVGMGLSFQGGTWSKRRWPEYAFGSSLSFL